MASTKSINRAAIAALVFCVYSQAVIAEAYAQSVSSGVSSGAPPSPASTPPPPAVPDITAAVSPVVSAVLAHPNQDTQVIDFAQLAGGVLNVPGDFTNRSTLYVVSTNSQVQTATIAAGGSILNSGTIYAQEFIRLKANGSIVFQNDGVQLNAAGVILDAGQDIDGANLHLHSNRGRFSADGK